MVGIGTGHFANQCLMIVEVASPPVWMREKRASQHEVLDSGPVFFGLADKSELGKVGVVIAVPAVFLIPR